MRLSRRNLTLLESAGCAALLATVFAGSAEVEQLQEEAITVSADILVFRVSSTLSMHFSSVCIQPHFQALSVAAELLRTIAEIEKCNGVKHAA